MSDDLVLIGVNHEPVVRAMRNAAAGLSNRRGLTRLIAGIMMRAVEDNFEAEGRPKWVDLKPSTKLTRYKTGNWPGRILQRSGQLAASIVQRYDNDMAAVGSNKVYARIQNLGGRTRPHVIRAKNKKALSFGGIVVRQVNHPGSNIPAREFLRLTPGDMREIILETREFLAKRFIKEAFNKMEAYLPFG
jgi:phage virion morphogenesis protein